MIKVGLTGNIGSGKSTVASVFQSLGIHVYHADDEAKRMYLKTDVLEKTISLAGTTIVDNRGELDRKALASIAFSNPSILKALNDLIHPLVAEHFRQWCEQRNQSPYIIHEAAIIFESGFRNRYDLVIHVSCPAGIALERIEKRDGLSRELIMQRMKAQLSDEEKSSLSDYVILNDGNTLVIPQVLQIHQELLKRST